jgi:Cu-Zn family superoxide dismutase
MKKWLMLLTVFALATILVACGDGNDEPVPATEADGVTDEETTENQDGNANPSTEDEANDNELASATVELMDNSGNLVGTAELIEEDEGVRMKVNAKDLPEGTHGFHFHEVGKCEGPDFESAGGHFNPTGTSHGLDHDEGPHAGDLANLEVGADGTVDEEFFVTRVTLENGEINSLLQEGGTALVIHAAADDGKTQPSGDSGDRIACGVVN